MLKDLKNSMITIELLLLFKSSSSKNVQELSMFFHKKKNTSELLRIFSVLRMYFRCASQTRKILNTKNLFWKTKTDRIQTLLRE